MTKKHLSEYAVNLFSSSFFILPADQVTSDNIMREEYVEPTKKCHIYAICKRPSIRFKKESIKYIKDTITGSIEYKIDGKIITKSFKKTYPSKNKNITIEVSKYPHREIVIHSNNGEEDAFFPSSIFDFHVDNKEDLKELKKLEVLYIGQSYANGKRSALDRLKSHSTLQKILAECNKNHPDDEVFILTFQYEPYRVISILNGNITGIKPSQKDIEQDNIRYKSIRETPLKKKQQICLAEAGLIRYFQPIYNKIYKDNFPSNKQKILEKCYKLDFCALAIEINTDELEIQLFSDTAPARFHHIGNFDLHDKNDRMSFFTINRFGKNASLAPAPISPSGK